MGSRNALHGDPAPSLASSSSLSRERRCTQVALGEQGPYRQLKVEDALAYLDKVRAHARVCVHTRGLPYTARLPFSCAPSLRRQFAAAGAARAQARQRLLPPPRRRRLLLCVTRVTTAAPIRSSPAFHYCCNSCTPPS